MGQLVAQLITWATEVVSTIGYGGIALLIALESVFPPIPSEVILPLAGSLAATGRFNFVLVVLAATLGSVMGATFLYGVGKWGGERRIGDFLDRYGKWLLLSRSDLETARAWFGRHGNTAVFGARLIPGLRSIVSIPAGFTAMPYWRFALLTALGVGLWDTVLVAAGYVLGKNWGQVEGWLAPFGPLVYLLIMLLIVVFVGRRLWAKFRPAATGNIEE